MKKVLMFAVALALAAAPAFAQNAKKADKPAKPSAKSGSVSGTVSAVTADSLTVKGKDGDVTMSVDAKTNVQATGASHKTAAAKADNKGTPITDFVHVGDMVTAKYSDSGTAKMATSVRVTSAKPAMGKK
jgi:hypothetical protein